MLVVYLTSLIVGGSLLSISLFAGGHGDVDADGGVEGHDAHDGDVKDGDAPTSGAALDVLHGWLPVTSMRFWTFFLAFFGLVGTALLLASPLSVALTAIPAAGVGYLSGVVAVRVLRALAGQQIGTTLAAGDLVGEVGQLLLPVGPGQPGKMRLQVAGRTVELVAESEDETLDIGDSAVVLGVNDEGGVWVSSAPRLGDGRERD